MSRKSLVTVVADDLRDRIVAGEFEIGSALPSEAELCARFDVSRVTVREGLRVLTAEGIVHVASGIGSTVNPLDEWQSLDALLRYLSARGNDGDIAEQLIAVRRMFETAAAAAAAHAVTDTDLDELESCLGGMRTASDASDVAAFVAADMRFHDVIMRRSGNVFLKTLFEPLSRVLRERREQTSRVTDIQRHAIDEHGQVLAALRARDAEAARTAMDRHMQQTLDDLRHYVLQR